jgi:hypothetical protein
MEWLKVRDTIYEEIMEKAWNDEKKVCSALIFLKIDVHSIVREQRGA